MVAAQRPTDPLKNNICTPELSNNPLYYLSLGKIDQIDNNIYSLPNLHQDLLASRYN